MIDKTELTLLLPSLPKALNGLKLVHLSDLHMGPRTSSSILKKIVDEITLFQPDLICFTGDFLIRSQLNREDELLEFLKHLKAPLCVASLGNHDYLDLKPHPQFISLLKKTSFKLLHNESYRFKNLQIVGLGDIKMSKCLPKRAFESTHKDLFTLVLTHNPDTIPALKPFRSDLILAGHTHGGQINLPLIWNLHTRLKHTKFKRGLLSDEGRQIYINRGLGNHTLFRLFSPPEMLFATLRSSS